MQQPPLASVIDMHCHCGPDSIPRHLDAVDLARLGVEYGMRGIVLKNHFEPTASLAYVVQKLVPEIAVFGGVTLNLAVGGMNPEAVVRMALVHGGRGRVVWMGSVDTEAQRRFDGSTDPAVFVSSKGELLPEVIRVLETIARYELILSTGHYSSSDVLLLIRGARACGVRDIVVTHAMMAPIHMDIEQMQQAVAMGAYIEFVYNGLVGPHKELSFAQYAEAIRDIGPSSCVVSTDLGQVVNPTHPEGFLAYIEGLRSEGINSAEIDCMCKTNPARLLRL